MRPVLHPLTLKVRGEWQLALTQSVLQISLRCLVVQAASVLQYDIICEKCKVTSDGLPHTRRVNFRWHRSLECNANTPERSYITYRYPRTIHAYVMTHSCTLATSPWPIFNMPKLVIGHNSGDMSHSFQVSVCIDLLCTGITHLDIGPSLAWWRTFCDHP